QEGRKASRANKETTKRTQTEPSRPTVKRLFALSGNLCAFPLCTSPLVDPETHSILGEICHIRGENPGSARYDPAQSPDDRHSFDNLVLMCGQHHKVIDDNPHQYPIDRLRAIKVKHESKEKGAGDGLNLPDAVAEQMIAALRHNVVTHGSVFQ